MKSFTRATFTKNCLILLEQVFHSPFLGAAPKRSR